MSKDDSQVVSANSQVRVGVPLAAPARLQRVANDQNDIEAGRKPGPDTSDSHVHVGAEPAQPARLHDVANDQINVEVDRKPGLDTSDEHVRVGAPLVAPAKLQDAANIHFGRCQSMSHSTAATLNDLNRRFYVEQASSFSSTRRGSWVGWKQALESAGIESAPSTVVDVACGNMRFESYLAERFPGASFNVIGIDNCPDLVAAEGGVSGVTGDSCNETSQVHVGTSLVAPARLQRTSADNALANAIDRNIPSGSVILSEARSAESKVGAAKASGDVILSEATQAAGPKVGAENASGDVILSGGRRPESKVGAENASGDVILSGGRRPESKNLAGKNAGSQVSIAFLYRDLIDLLLNNEPFGLPTGDLVVCFGFMHHVPGAANRCRMLIELLSAVKPGGILAISFWQFMSASSIAAQASELTQPALVSLGLSCSDIEPGDYILGWQNSSTARRYCHNFTLEEVNFLVSEALEESGLQREFTVDFFEADGRNNHLNCYLVAKRQR